MSLNDHTLTAKGQRFAREVDLGLKVPTGFCAGPLFPGDRIFRLHPNWFVQQVDWEGEGFSGRVKDYATEEEYLLSGSMGFDGPKGRLVHISLDDGSGETRITFFTRDNRLYVRLEAADEPAPTDPVLLWIKAVREYLRIYLKATPATLFWRLVMNRIILTMNPSQRKICLMIARFTLLEVLVILLIVIGYYMFVL